MRIEVGGGTLLTPGFINLDPKHGVGQWKRYAQDIPWPVEAGSVEAMRASHVMEHIASGPDRINVMNEAWRVLQPGGTFEIVVPLVMVHGKPVEGWWAWADPTHVSYWVMPESFHYFDGAFAANADYGIQVWQTKSMEIKNGWEGWWVGVKP